MSNVNDNNLDDLLRRAAEKYPLRTDNADFGKLVADLERDPSLILPPLNTEDRRRRRRFFWLFLFLPLAGGAYYVWHANSGRAHSTEVAAGGNAGTSAAGGTGKGTVTKTTGETPAIETTDKVDAIKNTEEKQATAEEKPATGTPADKGKGTNAEPGESGKQSATGSAGDAGQRAGVKKGEKATLAAIPGINGKATATGRTGADKKGTDVNGGRGTGGNAKAKNARATDAATMGDVGTDATQQTETSSALVQDDARIAGGKVSLAVTKGAVAVNIPVRSNVTGPVKSSTPAKDKIKLQKPRPSFYVGILGSPDISTIKFQSVKTVGTNFGVLLGYSFKGGRWAVETGLYYDRKKYYTDGEYFSKSKVPWLQYYNIATANGYCNMWEIPLNIRYNFSTGGKMKWFATAGSSNYLMSKEAYTFDGTNAAGVPWGGTWQYKKPYKYWFSILNLSVGYEQRLGKIGNLRLEPFLRVPLSGIGTGSLSIMSAGLNIGITRRIW